MQLNRNYIELFWSCAGLIIGFVMQSYEVTEGTPTVEVCAEVTEPPPVTPPSGIFPIPSIVQLSSINDSATGESVVNLYFSSLWCVCGGGGGGGEH